MTIEDAVDMLAPGLDDVRRASRWADLGCGDGSSLARPITGGQDRTARVWDLSEDRRMQSWL